MEATAIYKAAHKKWGSSHQAIVCIEELAELQKEFTKILRNAGNIEHLAEEMADVMITVEQMAQIYHLEDRVELYKEQKLMRLQDRINYNVKFQSDQLCWNCTKSGGGCSWSKNFTPVVGWTASPTKKRSGKAESFRITECPEFEREEK